MSIADCIYHQRLKYKQVETMNHASIGTNYAILTQCIKAQHQNKLASNLKSMHSVCFEQTTTTKFIKILLS